MPPADQSQPKSVPAQPGKEIFKNAPRATKKKDNGTVGQKSTSNRLIMWMENKKNEKHDAPTMYIRHWASGS